MSNMAINSLGDDALSVRHWAGFSSIVTDDSGGGVHSQISMTRSISFTRADSDSIYQNTSGAIVVEHTGHVYDVCKQQVEDRLSGALRPISQIIIVYPK